VHGAAAEDQIVLADTGSRIGGHELDDPADAAEHPLARTTLPMTVRLFVPGPAANTMVPPSVSVPLVAAAADMAGATVWSVPSPLTTILTAGHTVLACDKTTVYAVQA